MASRTPRPLPPSPDSRARLLSDASDSDSSEHVSVFPNASGPMQINDGDFSAIKGSRFGHLQIVINQGGPRVMNSSRTGRRKPDVVSGPRSASTTPRIARPRPAGKDTGIEMLSEIAEQISERCKETEQYLDDREAELDAKERDLAIRLENVRMRENELRRKERQLATHASDIDERLAGLDYAEHKLSLLKDNLLLREDLVKNAIEDLRDRERAFEELSISAQRNAYTCSSESPCGANSRAASPLPVRAPSRQLPSISPNRRRLSIASATSSHSANVEEISKVRVTHKRQLPPRPSSPAVLYPRRGHLLPLAPSPECRGLSDRESSGNEWDGLSDVSSDEEFDDCFGDEREIRTLSDRPPTYHSAPAPNLHSEPFEVELAEKLRAALFSTLKVSPKGTATPEAIISVSTSFAGAALREQVDDIALLDDGKARDRAISWAIEKLVETGRFDEDTIQTLCKRVSEDERSADVAVCALKKDLERPHLPLIQLYAVRLLRMMLANSNPVFHEQCSLPHFMEALEAIKRSENTSPAVRKRTGEVIEEIRKCRSALSHFALHRIDEAKVYESLASSVVYGMAY